MSKCGGYGITYSKVHINIDTMVETVYRDQQGARKGYNPRQRAKKEYRPVLGLIDETREYLNRKPRKGETLSGKETSDFLKKIRPQLPDCVRYVLVRADDEFCSWVAVYAALEERFEFVFANKSCKPPFDQADLQIQGAGFMIGHNVACFGKQDRLDKLRRNAPIQSRKGC